MQVDMPKQRRVIAYVDGFNVYYGLKRKKWNRFLWLSYRDLLETILLPGQDLVTVKYFTAMSPHGDSKRRQQTYLEALEIHGGVEIFLGKIVHRPHRCKQCDSKTNKKQEKESDVRMAVEMILDAVDQRMDEVWLMSRDSDLCPVVERLRERFDIKVVVIKPPNGSKDSSGGDALVQSSGNGPFHIRRSVWGQCQLPDAVQRERGAPRKKRPKEWI